MIATNMTTSGAPEEKLRWAFKMYDRDGSGMTDMTFGWLDLQTGGV